ncbi:MAG: hypothetical protein DLM59_15925 [Pseudonocardiales bacterium]|nr:MAG: hypothetical protein DLM59_15925 [Pseudonocardiales bacterium]
MRSKPKAFDGLGRLGRATARAAAAPARAVHARLDAQDAAAQARGWTVEALPAGGRVYRDPRFDQLATTNRAASVAADQQEVCS